MIKFSEQIGDLESIFERQYHNFPEILRLVSPYLSPFEDPKRIYRNPLEGFMNPLKDSMNLLNPLWDSTSHIPFNEPLSVVGNSLEFAS